jgi:hypothetical protein
MDLKPGAIPKAFVGDLEVPAERWAGKMGYSGLDGVSRKTFLEISGAHTSAAFQFICFDIKGF